MAKQKAKKQAPKKASNKATGVWGRNYYIRNHGHVKIGEEVTQEALDAFYARSNGAKPQIEG